MTQHPLSNRSSRGLAVLAGAGPGDEGLITVAAASWLGRADCVVYDRLANPSLLKLAPVSAEKIYVGKGPGKHEMTQEQINRVLIEQTSQGKIVVRLKGGDPLIFGRGGEEADALRQAGLDYRIVPGVTSGLAAGAYAGIPLTDRRVGPTLALVTGHEDAGESAVNWKALAGIDTLVFYMGVGHLAGIVRSLIAAGKAAQTPAVIVQRATTPGQKTVVGTLETIVDIASRENVVPPSIIIVGEVVAYREGLGWFERLPLFGKTVLVTRSRGQASALAGRLAELGAAVIEAPTIEIATADDVPAIDATLGRLAEFDWVVLTSPNGADALMGRLFATEQDARALAGTKIAAVGPGTNAALAGHGLKADLVPAEFTTLELGKALAGAAGSLAGKRVLLARADIATPGLCEILLAAGAQVEEVTLYRTALPASLPAEAIDALGDGRVDWITFTSSSTVDNFVAMLAKSSGKFAAGAAEVVSKVKLAAIGPVTAKTLESHGWSAKVVADPHTIDALVEAIVRCEVDES